jgi:carbamoyltransferase
MSNDDVWILAITRGHNGGGCLLKNGEIVFSSEEERFSRQKYDGAPYATIVKTLDFTDKLDYLVISHTVPVDQNSGCDYTGDNDYVAVARKLGLIDRIPSRGSSHPQVIDVGHIHHKMHAACAFYKSGFENATVVIVDGAGSFSSLSDGIRNVPGFETESIMEASYPDNFINVYKHMGTNDTVNTVRTKFKHKDELFQHWDEDYELTLSDRAGIVKTYEAITEYCGFNAIEAGKTMGLFPYGNSEDPMPPLYEDFDNEFTLSNRNAIIPQYPMSASFNSALYSDYSFAAYGEKEYNLQNRKNAAYAVQIQSQKQVANLIRKAYDMTGNKNIVISGGYGLNCVANYYYREELKDLIEEGVNIYVEPISSDAGTAIGAALLWWYHKTESTEVYGNQSLYLGIDYNIQKEEVYDIQSKYHIGVDVKEDVSYEEVIDLVTDKNIVALFQGRSESGPRALGNRSFIYDPTDPNGKDHVNTVKNREFFRPFAGSILEEDVHEWFDLRGMESSPHMMYAVNCQPGIEEKIPSIIHEDGTCRIQTVTEEQNPNYYNLIKTFKEKTGVPIVFNTSFNLGGEPLVETLDDAVRTIVNSKVEYLYLPELKILVTSKNAEIK